MVMQRTDMVGRIYGQLVVVEYAGVNPLKSDRSALWRCICLCGMDRVISAKELHKGKYIYCGERTCPHSPKNRDHVDWKYTKQPKRKYANKEPWMKNKILFRKEGFSLTPEELLEVVARPCFYCAGKPTVSLKHSLGRFNEKLGYVSDNVISLCRGCRALKGDMTHGEFLRRVKAVSEHMLLVE